ncbi:MAG: hypothetical protein ACUBOA_12640 [Candidatus Loosdrechtia sp.]|uniref:hypothetical protein n=1 Tax=Candidatus Loosdrechtia sp. TaxID=3101272 RepID=UPI00403AD474
MVQNYFYRVRQLWLGILLSLVTLFYGFGMGAVFGISEDRIKESLKASAREVYDTVYKGNTAEMSKTTDKSWAYFKRSHVHATGMATASLVMIILLSHVNGQRRVRVIAAIGLGAGSMGYSLFWLFAGMLAPGLGSTGLAKTSLAWLSIPSTGIFLLAVITVIVIFIWGVLRPELTVNIQGVTDPIS